MTPTQHRSIRSRTATALVTLTGLAGFLALPSAGAPAPCAAAHSCAVRADGGTGNG